MILFCLRRQLISVQGGHYDLSVLGGECVHEGEVVPGTEGGWPLNQQLLEEPGAAQALYNEYFLRRNA